MRISNCSRESLSINAARFTVYFLISIGRGTGPTISALWRAAVSIICLTEESKMPCSYARTRMRRRCIASAFIGRADFEVRGVGVAEEPSTFPPRVDSERVEAGLAERTRGARLRAGFFAVASGIRIEMNPQSMHYRAGKSNKRDST